MYLFIFSMIISISSGNSYKECPPCEIIINSLKDYNLKIDYKWPLEKFITDPIAFFIEIGFAL